MCVSDIEFTYFYDSSIQCWNCSESVIYIFFHFIIGYEKKPAELQLLKKKYGCHPLP
jgi:ABC-type anion transport system duplicated permease subunit